MKRQGRGSTLRHLKIALGVILLSAVGCGQSAPPDVILVTLDTTRADHISAYGYSRPITPELDRFARDAVLFRQAWSTAGWTLPAHASMFTGKYPTSHGAHNNATGGNATLAEVVPNPILKELRANRLGEEQVTLAELLRDAGYETGAFVGGPWLSPVFGLLQGYSIKDADVRSTAGRSADILTNNSIAWIRDVPTSRPLHLLVNYFDPHFPYLPPPGYDDLPYAKAPMTLDPNAVVAGRPLPPDQRAIFIDRYDGEVRFMDHQFGRLLQALRDSGRYDNAVIVVVADHGESLGEHGLVGHVGWLYEEVLRVPLLVRFPGGRRSGTEIAHPVSVVDLLPMIAREANLTLPEDVEGVPIGRRSLVFAESYRLAFAVKRLGAHFDRDVVAAIRWPWKLLLPDRGKPELYRLDEDPWELDSRVNDQVESELREAIQSARAAFKPPDQPSIPENVSPSTLERLRSLGYIE